MKQVLTTSLIEDTTTSKAFFRIETIGSYFVVRAKSNLQFKAKRWKRRLPENVLSDAVGELTVYNSSKAYPVQIRKVCYWDKEQKRQFTFLTNAMELSSLQVAELYKNRWPFCPISSIILISKMTKSEAVQVNQIYLIFKCPLFSGHLLLHVVNKKYEGATKLQQNPYKSNTMPWASWIIARLGAWSGYKTQSIPGYITIKEGLEKFYAQLEVYELLS